MNRQQAIKVLWREWVSSDYKDREYLIHLLELLQQQRGGVWGAGLLSVVLAVCPALALAPLSLFAVFILHDGNGFRDCVVDGLNILAQTAVVFGAAGCVTGCILPWKYVFKIVLVSAASALVPYFGVFLLFENEVAKVAGMFALGALLIACWGGTTVAASEAILLAGAYTLMPIVAVFRLSKHIHHSEALGLRGICIWWRKRPDYRQVEQAWKKLGDAEISSELESLHMLCMSNEELTEALSDLSSGKWQERWRARQTCVRFGGAAARALTLRDPNTASPTIQYPWAESLIKCISRDTKARLGKGRFFCPQCLCQVTRQRAKRHFYFGCRLCGRSHDVMPVAGQVICALDRQASKVPMRRGRNIYINWLTASRLPDCDRIEIMDVGDEEVETFTIAVGNDTDQERRKRYAKVTCLLCCRGALSPNSIRLLRQTFRRVRIVRPSKPSAAIAGHV